MKQNKLFCEMSPLERIKDYHRDDVWGLFLKWLAKLNKKKGEKKWMNY